MATTYRIETTGRGLPRETDAAGYDTVLAAEAMAETVLAEGDEYWIVDEATGLAVREGRVG
jgi:hypothetical protein